VSLKDGRIELHVNEIGAMVQGVINTANRLCQHTTESARKVYSEAIANADKIRNDCIANLGAMKILADLTGGFTDQSDAIKDEARDTYIREGVLESDIGYAEWAVEWWATQKHHKMVAVLSGIVRDEAFSQFLRDRSFRDL
jgi:uncharacterized protein CbrC (UPF0167 family)